MDNKTNTLHPPKRTAFTLLEVILALSLSILLLAALSMAIDLNLRLLDSGRTKVEEAQLARTILKIIAQDLRSAIPYQASKSNQNSSGASSGMSAGTSPISSIGPTGLLAKSTRSGSPFAIAIGIGVTGQGSKSGGNTSSQTGGKTGGTTGGATGGTTGGATGGTAGGATGGTAGGATGGASGGAGATPTDTTATDATDAAGATAEDRTTDLADAAPQAAPGLYGNAYELQVDISRPLRADQFLASMNQAEGAINADQLSDVKTVSYFVINSGVQATAGTSATQSAIPHGLVRREMGRITGVYAAQQGQVPDTSLTSEPFAPEVSAIEFKYFDGTQWLDTWDSVTYSSLPLAVEISISVIPLTPGNQNTQPSIYKLMVNIPAAQASALLSATSADTTSTSSSTSTTTTPATQ